jgi:hypothetical protein
VRNAPTQEATTQQNEAGTVGLGEVAEVGDISFRAFDVRTEDTAYYMEGPGSSAASRENVSGEYVAIDYVAENASDSPLTTEVEARLEDTQGYSHGEDGFIEPPEGGTDGMDLGPGQKKASTVFFDVPSGTTPEVLRIKSFGKEARIDLTQSERDEIPPEDYLRVYHTYFNERAYEEAYGMLDPASTQEVTLGDWLSFYEPLWGERYISVDGLDPLSSGTEEAAFFMERSFYRADGSQIPDEEVNADVTQEMVRDGEEWKLVMRRDLVEDILSAEASATTTAPAEPTTVAPETTLAGASQYEPDPGPDRNDHRRRRPSHTDSPADSASPDSASSASGGDGTSYPPISKDNCPPNAPIKGNQSDIYHVPGGAYYDETDPEKCFATEADARAAGYRASER